MINCNAIEVSFTQSTTQGLNLVANGIDWKKGDIIILRGGRHEHYANYFPWLYVAKRKKLKIFGSNFISFGKKSVSKL